MSHCVYGNDADLINLVLITQKPKIGILREHKSQFSMLYITKLRDYMELEFQNRTELKFTFELQRVIDDFIFLVFLLGNDYLPE